MPADLICLSKDKQKVVVAENKLGSGFTGTAGDPATGQLAKQADFLLRCRIPSPYLLLLSTAEQFKKRRYLSELVSTLEHGERNKRVVGYLMHWEDVLAAVH